MKVALAQINPVVADIKGNYNKIVSYVHKAKAMGANLVVFPEMATIGYPPLDLLENRKLIDDNIKSIEGLAGESADIAIICGFVDYSHKNSPMLHNGAALLHHGKIISRHYKTLLPTYDVFDELRYFTPAPKQETVLLGENNLGITICEDIWHDTYFEENIFIEKRKYAMDPVKNLTRQGVDLIVNISASPYIEGKNSVKWKMISNLARESSKTIIYVNQVGGNDGLIFDGYSFIIDNKGTFIARAKGFEEDLLLVDLQNTSPSELEDTDGIGEIRRALVLGLRDYVKKCGFSDVIIGLSGGIDSAVTTALAVEALGPDRVMVVTMPSQYSSRGSVDDSVKLAKNLGIRIENIPIQNLFEQYKDDLKEMFKGHREGVAEENIQARIRGNLLMSISNKFGSLLLTTGNKSELAMGYCTLYGDMSGGLSVISDLSKTKVYQLAHNFNREKEVIPIEIIEKPPSAELRENQKDEDSLPPYELLDQILKRYIEDRKPADDIIREGFPEDIVNDVLRTVNRNEYKRRQAPMGLKVTTKAFGYGRWIPIANRFNP